MHRTLLLTLSIFILAAVSSAARATAPFRAGSQPDAKKSSPPQEDRGKIIADVKADLSDVVEHLNKNDAGERTRAKQKRIIDNLTKLLDQEDDSPDSPNRSPGDSPKPMNPPSDSQSRRPKPAANSPEPKRPAEIAGNKEEHAAPATSVNELPKARSPMGRWGEYPPRLRPEMDAFARERFVRRYEDLLREYYRSLAESGRRED